jgi:hypothetical protein
MYLLLFTKINTMEGVEFDEPQQGYSFGGQRTNEPKLGTVTRFFIKLGLAKDQRGADKIMIIVSIISLLLMTYFLISTYAPNLLSFSKPNQSTLPPELQQRLDAMNNGTIPVNNQ